MSQELTRKDFIRLSIAFVAVASGVGACSSGTNNGSSGTSGTSGTSSGDNDSGTSSGDIDSGTSSGGNDSGSDTGASSGGNDAGKDASGTTCGSDVTLGDAQIASNHGHGATIPKADLMGSADKTYSIQGSAGHSHNLTLTAANFASLRAGNTVVVDSSTTGHNHSCTVKCA